MKKKQSIKVIFISILPSVLLSVTAVLFAYWRAIASIPPSAIIRPIIFLVILILLLYFVIDRFVKNPQTTGLLLVVFVSGFYMMEQLFYLTVFISAVIFFTSWLVLKILKKKLEAKYTLFFLHAISYTLTLLVLLQFIAPFRLVNWAGYNTALSRTQNNLPTLNQPISNKPDIYYIILDAYARSDILQDYYDYDNSEFISHLNEKGFIVPANVYSNYPYTALSVSSTLNIDYVDNITAGLESSHFWWLMEPYIFESRMHLFLEQEGYQTVFIASDWHITDNRNAEQYFTPNPISLNEFEGFMLSATPLKTLVPLIKTFASVPSNDFHRELILYNFNALADISEIPGPKFVFSHIIVPHPPFVFDKFGNHITPNYGFSFTDGNDYPGTDEEYQTKYIEQLQYTNELLKETIDAILSQSQNPPIIIIQADHGSRMLGGSQTTQDLCVKERFSIFAAYYLPGLERDSIPDDITPVNIFRIILNEYFKTDLDILENESLLPLDKLFIYQTESVQGLLQTECTSP